MNKNFFALCVLYYSLETRAMKVLYLLVIQKSHTQFPIRQSQRKKEVRATRNNEVKPEVRLYCLLYSYEMSLKRSC